METQIDLELDLGLVLRRAHGDEDDDQKINSLFCPLREMLQDSYSFLDPFFTLLLFCPDMT